MTALLARLLLSARYSRVLALMVASLVWLLLVSMLPVTWQQLDERGTDALWSATASPETERRVIVVDIDEASLGELGAWPWPRDLVARLSEKLDAQGVSLKLFDIVFPEDGGAAGSPASQSLAKALNPKDSQVVPSVMAQVFSLQGESTIQSGRLAGAIPDMACQPSMAQAQGFVGNQPGLGPLAGHITPRVDSDGAIRRVPALICWKGRVYPALAVAALMTQAPGTLQISAGQTALDPAWRIRFAGLPGVAAPLDERGDLRVPFRLARQGFVSVSAADLLQDRVPANLLTGAWVIVGASAFGIGDAVPTALGGRVSGVEVHAQLLLSLLDQTIPYAPRGSSVIQAAFGLVGVLLLLMLLSGTPLQTRQRVVMLPVAAGALGLGLFALHTLALFQFNLWIRWAPAALAIILSGLFLALAEHARAVLQKSRLYQNLASYLSPSVAEQIALTTPTGQIEAQRRDVTILVADLRNFSRYCEDRPPEDAAWVLHSFFTRATEVLEKHGAVVEDMVGDSVLAVFNGSRPCEHHAVHALEAAQDLWRQSGAMLPQFSGPGLEPLALGIGLESGLALVGSFGPAHRRVHTALGPTVTTALGLQGMTADLAYPILIGQEAATRIAASPLPNQPRLKSLGVFLLPGLRQSGEILTLQKPFFSSGPRLFEDGTGEHSNVLFLQTRSI